MTLYDVRKADWRSRVHTGRSVSYWPVYVEAVDTEKREVLASWNSNKAEWMSERRITKYRATLPKQK